MRGTGLPSHDETKGVLVLGGAYAGLAVVRSLGRRNIPVWFVTAENILPSFSRYARKTFVCPDLLEKTGVEFLLDLARRHGLRDWLLFPGGDEETQMVSRNHAALAPVFRLLTPPWEEISLAYDKHLTYDRAGALGLHFPRSYYTRSRDALDGLGIQFPAILKPTVKDENNAFTREKAWRVDNREELRKRFDEAAACVGGDAIVIQELVPGRGDVQYSYAGLWDRGRPVASLVARRLRQYPIDFGYSSTFVRTAECADVEDAACRFLKSMNYHGIVEVEFKYDVRDKRYKLLDVNARPWFWLGLGARAGVDFPFLAWRMARGEKLPAMRAKSGATWVYFSRDIAAAAQETLCERRAPKTYFRSLPRLVPAVFAWDDPLPGIVDLPLIVFRGNRFRSLIKRKWQALTGQTKPVRQN